VYDRCYDGVCVGGGEREREREAEVFVFFCFFTFSFPFLSLSGGNRRRSEGDGKPPSYCMLCLVGLMVILSVGCICELAGEERRDEEERRDGRRQRAS
jgi:Na+-driven multidrug efflux pump